MPTIVDAQVHIWLPDSSERPWPKDGRVKPHLDGGFSAAQLLALMDQAGVDRAVLVPPSWEGERIDYVIDATRRWPDRFVAMARIAADDPALPGHLRAWRDQGLAGARLTFTRPAERAWLSNGTTDWLWAEAEALGMPVMLHGTAGMDNIDAIATRHPRLKIIVDHMGLYQIKSDDPEFAPALARTRGVARHPNVHVKLTSLPHYSVEAYPHADLRPHLRELIAAFGARRCFWGTDITKLLAHCGYRDCVEHVLGLDFLTAEDQEWILGRGLLECLGWK